MNYHFAYLVGALLFDATWLGCYLIGKRYRPQIIWGTGVLYFLLFVYFLALYPDFIERYYNLSNISGIRLLGVPIEELMFAASGGAVWSVAYEYFQGYRFAPGPGFRLVEL